MKYEITWYEKEITDLRMKLHTCKESLNKSYLISEKYKQGYEECRNILNPEQLRIIENKLKELGIL